MSVKNGRLYQYLLDKSHIPPLALTGAVCARALFRTYLHLRAYLWPRAARAEASFDSDAAQARERLMRAFPKPTLTRGDAVTLPCDPSVDLSILVPVYNVSEYFDTCVQSVFEQRTKYTYELILIDDGSDEATVRRVRAYEGDARVKLFRQENQGAAAARNRALNMARGKYVMFLDADDLLLPGAIERLLSCAEETGADWVQGGWEYVDGPRQRFPYAVYEGESRMQLIELPGMPWGKVIRRELFAFLRFPSGYTSYVDTSIKCLTLRMAKRAATISDIVYAWRRNPGGITFTSKRTSRALQTYWIMEQMREDSLALHLPEDDLYYAIWIRQMTTVNYDRLKGLDERTQRDVFLLSCAFLADILAHANAKKLPFALALARRAFMRRDFGLWRALGRFYAFTL